MKMSDYKEMYLKMVRATEQAINILIKAQQECEELYISGREWPADALSEGQSRLRGAGDWPCVRALTGHPRDKNAPELRDQSGADG